LTQDGVNINLVTMTIWVPELGEGDAPLYLALADALAEDVASGRLAAGVRLPTHRGLAEKLGVTVGTVSRGYAEAARRGLLSGEVGRGTFVRVPAPPEAGDAPGDGLVDLSVNYPPVTPVEAAAFRRTLAALEARPDLATLLAYRSGPTAAHRAAGASWIARTGLQASADRVLLTCGSQHALAVLFTSLLEPGDLVLTESLTYPGVVALARRLRIRLHGLPTDEDGVRPDALQAALRRGEARALYCMPTLQNPTNAVMPRSRRREIAGIARERGLLLFEDDIHGHLLEDAPKPLAAFAPEITYYFSSTSKVLAPGLRIAYMLVPEGAVERLSAGVRATTWMVAPLMAEIATGWIEDGTADAILAAKRREAAARQALARRVLAGFAIPNLAAAYHVWLPLPPPWKSDELTRRLRRRGVAVTPAEVFAVGPVPEGVRVCLGAARTRAELERGLKLVAETLARPADTDLAIV
jgi:DNA-binding transcriptional MocR family regulator